MATDIIEDAKLKWRLGRADVVHRENEEIDYRLQFGDEKIDPITIGVHVRRGLDLIQNQRNLNHGHVAAPNNYYEAAIKHFRDTFPNVVFLVSSDDVQWAKANLLVEQAGELYFLPKSTDREVGMAVMSGCDHLIISTGTFSWWAAYLADNERNEIIYYKDWPREGSELAKMINKSEFFLPRWMPM